MKSSHKGSIKSQQATFDAQEKQIDEQEDIVELMMKK
jgi:hypothetical protein